MRIISDLALTFVNQCIFNSATVSAASLRTIMVLFTQISTNANKTTAVVITSVTIFLVATTAPVTRQVTLWQATERHASVKLTHLRQFFRLSNREFRHVSDVSLYQRLLTDCLVHNFSQCVQDSGSCAVLVLCPLSINFCFFANRLNFYCC
jgi:hypothetical protein